MRRSTLLLSLACALVPAAPAAALVPPLDQAGGQTSLSLGLPVAGIDWALGRVVVGVSAGGAVVPFVGLGYGFAGRLGWRLTGLPGREFTLGPALVFGNFSTAGAATSDEAWFVQPGLACALPIGRAATLRVMAGPLFWRTWARVPGTLASASGAFPFLPDVQLAVRLAEGHELTVGGLPSLVGWRGTF